MLVFLYFFVGDLRRWANELCNQPDAKSELIIQYDVAGKTIRDKSKHIVRTAEEYHFGVGQIENWIVPFRWVTADEVFGGDSKFRRSLENRALSTW